MAKGQTFLGEPDKNSKGKETRHLRIVVTDTNDNNECLVVSVTSWHDGVRGQDPSCILQGGCHPFITHTSWVDFSRCRVMTDIEIFNGIHKGLLRPYDNLDPFIVQSIQGAVSISEYIPEELTAFFEYF